VSDSNLKKTPYELWKGKRPNIGYFHPFGGKCFVHNNGKDNLGKFDPISDEGIFLGYSNNSRSFRVYNKRTLCVEESVHIIFYDNNSTAEKGVLASDNGVNQIQPKISEQVDPKDFVDNGNKISKLTNEATGEHAESQTKSTTQHAEAVPRKWRSEPEYPQKFVIGNPNNRIKTRGALKKKDNIALISQIEPKKVDEALKDSSRVQDMQEELDQFDKNQVWTLVPKLTNASIIGTKWVFKNKLNEVGKVI